MNLKPVRRNMLLTGGSKVHPANIEICVLPCIIVHSVSHS